MIFEDIVFIHIPKKADNSIQNVLKHYSEDKIVCFNPWRDGVERFKVRNKNFSHIHKHSSLLDHYQVLSPDVFHSLSILNWLIWWHISMQQKLNMLDILFVKKTNKFI